MFQTTNKNRKQKEFLKSVGAQWQFYQKNFWPAQNNVFTRIYSKKKKTKNKGRFRYLF